MDTCNNPEKSLIIIIPKLKIKILGPGATQPCFVGYGTSYVSSLCLHFPIRYPLSNKL